MWCSDSHRTRFINFVNYVGYRNSWRLSSVEQNPYFLKTCSLISWLESVKRLKVSKVGTVKPV